MERGRKDKGSRNEVNKGKWSGSEGEEGGKGEK